MNKKHTTTPKLFHEDEFRPIINMYNNMDISTSRLCEIINDKAEKITALNAELLEALQEYVNLEQGHISKLTTTPAERLEKGIAAIKKANE